jgi:hypothetical protein
VSFLRLEFWLPRFWEVEDNSYKEETMIARTIRCNEFIDTYGVIAIVSFSSSSYVLIVIRFYNLFYIMSYFDKHG